MNHQQVENWIGAAMTDLKAASASKEKEQIKEHLEYAKESIDQALDYAEREEGE